MVASLAIPGKPPDPRVGAVPLSPGRTVAHRTRIGITWSGCYGTDRLRSPHVVGLTFPAARRATPCRGARLGLLLGRRRGTTTTTHHGASTTGSTSAGAVTTTTKRAADGADPGPVAGSVLQPGATVTITMHHCPQ